ncbi:hypothetical protein [Wolbachia endosymbiont of Folsomia candida]|uniref:hypothetical protein n=1 Tax=Wolbachia endosymbiont of Folsomia candida TaxID=169402 RepID=UPI000B113742|nr:hypothetical protein [Wolbachia endosymbiont of Folsomia candida]APR98990.1 hypothetical protein ASM33_07330 [Wolbachia endosymbiont of Folsomia candida]
MNWNNLHKAICDTLKAEIPEIQTCEIYPAVRTTIVAPAVFVELASLEAGKDAGTEELALRARFEARIVIDSTIENAPLVVRTLAAEVARVINKNTWGMNVSPAEFLSGESDGFRPELDAYFVWLIEWIHEVHLGQSVWEGGKIKPHSINVGDVNVGK